MSEKWAYDYTPEELMTAFWKATVRAATSNSGLIFDCAAGYLAQEAFYFHGVVLSRLEGKRPPLARGEKVRMCPKETYRCGSVNSVYQGDYSSYGEAKPDKEYEIWRVFYEKGKWTLGLKATADSDFQNYRFPADRFEKVKQAEPVEG